MTVQDMKITNDFDTLMFVLYDDRHHHIMVLAPNETQSMSTIVRDKFIELEKLLFWLQDFKTGEYQYLKLLDINFSAIQIAI